MRTSRPASWFLQAAKESSRQPAAGSRRYFHATCRCQQADNNGSKLPPAPEQPRERSNGVLNASENTDGQSNVPAPYDRRLKSSTWTPETAKRHLQSRRERVQQVRKKITEEAKRIQRYKPSEIEKLRQLYTPQQIEALLAAEEAIDPEDVVSQGELRKDPAGLTYLDDLASVDPVLDKLAQGPEIKYGTDLDGGAVAEQDAQKGKKTDSSGDNKGLTEAQKRLLDADEDPHLIRLCQQTGFTQDQIKRFRVKNLVTRRVTNQTRMGKIMSLSFLTIAGNGNGLLGIGEGKAAEGEDGQRQAMMNAIRNMKPVHRYEGRTIYGEVEGKVGAVRVKLMPRAPGFGCRTQHLIFEMCRAAGIDDLAARTPKPRNKMNVCKATWKALLSQKLPEEIAIGRGLKMVDVRKVYYAGNV